MSDQAITVIEARPSTRLGLLRSTWQHRQFYPVLLKEISMRKFRPTLLGFWWLILRPLIPTTIAIVVFTFFIQINTEPVPYGVFFITGFMVWHLFHTSVRYMSRTLLWTRSLLKKMYLPKLLVPLASIGPALVELAVTIVLFGILLGIYYYQDGIFYLDASWRILWVVPCLALTLVLAISVGMVVSVIALFMRDIVYSITYVLQIGFILTPVVYPLTVLPESARWVVHAVNPMAILVDTARWALTGAGAFQPAWFVLGCLQVALIAYLCLTFFTRAETYLADTV